MLPVRRGRRRQGLFEVVNEKAAAAGEGEGVAEACSYAATDAQGLRRGVITTMLCRRVLWCFFTCR